jgi:hypothetical protein
MPLSGNIAPLFLDLGTRRRWVVSYTLLQLYPSVSIGQEAAWVPERVWKLWRRENSCTTSVTVSVEDQQRTLSLQHYCLFNITAASGRWRYFPSSDPGRSHCSSRTEHFPHLNTHSLATLSVRRTELDITYFTRSSNLWRPIPTLLPVYISPESEKPNQLIAQQPASFSDTKSSGQGWCIKPFVNRNS